MSDISEVLQRRVQDAYQSATPLCIVGGNSKAFYGRACSAEILNTGEHAGIVNYAPTELVITARAGTLLADIEAALSEQKQMLGFEPPHFGNATLGGTIACNFSGPRRAYAGAARDFVLGCKLINGRGEYLKFGGEVMKNVAGYDVSRLMTGAMGTLGVLSEISLKVLPLPEAEITLAQECKVAQALQHMHQWAASPLPISASCYDGDRLYVRLSASENALRAAQQRIGGELMNHAEDFWKKIREHKHAFFDSRKPLWRLSVDSNAEAFDLDGKTIYEWGGALRWLLTEEGADAVRASARSANGHALLFKGSANDKFSVLDNGLLKLHQKLKTAFDPRGILNPGRMYAEF